MNMNMKLYFQRVYVQRVRGGGWVEDPHAFILSCYLSPGNTLPYQGFRPAWNCRCNEGEST